MVKRKLLDFLYRLIPCLVVALVLIASFCFVPGIDAHANVANGAKLPNNWAPLQFDYIYAQKASNGYNYFIDWPLNSFTDRGFNFQSDYVVENGSNGTEFFSIAGTPYMKELSDTGDSRLGVTCNLNTSHDWDTYDGSIFLSADQMYIPQLAIDQALEESGFYYVWFGNGGYTFLVDVSFDINYVIKEGPVNGEYTYRINRTNANISMANDLIYVMADAKDDPQAGRLCCSVDLLEIFANLIYEFTPISAVSETVFLTNVSVRFHSIDPYAESAFTPLNPHVIGIFSKLYYEDAYNGSAAIQRYPASNFQFFFDDLNLKQTVVEDVTIVESEFPKDWTGWLATALDGFFNFQFVPGFSVGMIFAGVFGVLMLWFILHLFM